MQRLYEVRDRIEIHEHQPQDAAPKLASEVEVEVEDDPDSEPDSDPSIDWAEETGEPAGDFGAADNATGPKVTLPEGEIIEEKAVSPAEPPAAPGNADARSGSVLKAERVML